MKRLFLRSFIASSLVLLPCIAAQAAEEQPATPYYSPDEYQSAHSMFAKIRADLYRAQVNDRPGIVGDGARFHIARMQLGQLENQWNQAEFDTGTFDKTYTALNMVLSDNRLTGHDRDVLSADESRLIEFRNEYY